MNERPPLDILAGALSHMRELKRTADWPKPTSTASPAVRPTGRVVTPARKREILESKDSRYILTLTGSKVLSPAGLRALLASNPFDGTREVMQGQMAPKRV